MSVLDFLDTHFATAIGFAVGMAMFGSKSYAESAVEFALLGREFPRSELRDDAAYWECMSYFRQMRPAQFDPTFAQKSTDCFSEMEMRFPESDNVAASRARRAARSGPLGRAPEHAVRFDFLRELAPEYCTIPPSYPSDRRGSLAAYHRIAAAGLVTPHMQEEEAWAMPTG
mgnify:CR=1 FL=1